MDMVLVQRPGRRRGGGGGRGGLVRRVWGVVPLPEQRDVVRGGALEAVPHGHGGRVEDAAEGVNGCSRGRAAAAPGLPGLGPGGATATASRASPLVGAGPKKGFCRLERSLGALRVRRGNEPDPCGTTSAPVGFPSSSNKDGGCCSRKSVIPVGPLSHAAR